MIILYRILPILQMVVSIIVLQVQPSMGQYLVFYGHLHNHSEVSDGVDSPQEAYRYARESGHLDFFGLSDHSEQIHGDEWELIRNAANQYNQPGVFTTFYGFEWTDNQLGHISVINTDDYTTPALCNYTFAGLCSWLHERDGIAFLNHPGRYNSTGHEFEHFEGSQSDRIVGIEMWNRTDRFEMFYYTDGYFRNDDNKSYYDEALSRGWKIGATGSEDNHTGTYGYTTDSRLAVLASENSREAIFEALKARRFFSTYDKNMVLSFQIDGNEMGSEAYAGNRTLQIQANDPDGEIFATIDLVKNGNVVQSFSPNTSQVNIQQAINCGHGDYFYLHVKQADGDEALTSSIRINKANQPPGTSLRQPLPNTNYVNPASVTLLAEAEDSDGSIEKVEFYQEDELVGESFNSPYSCTWKSASTGTFRFKVRAVDNMGAEVVSKSVRIVVTNPGEPVMISSQIATGMDDVEESSLGSMVGNMNSSDIELVDDYGTRGENQTVGLRFTDLNIPQGVYITNACIQFTCDEESSDSGSLTIAGEASGYSDAFTRDPYNVSERNRTLAQVHWMPEPWTVEGEQANTQRTPDLKSIVQEIINRPDYNPAGAISMIITGAGTRTAVSYEGNDLASPVMMITYSYTKPNEPPVVKLTAPQEGAEYMAPSVIFIQAEALDTDGEIEKVDFYQDSTLLKTEYYAPYTFEWAEVAEGSYRIKAIATDNSGDTAQSITMVVSVKPEVVSRTFTARISSAVDDAEETYKGRVNLNGDDLELVYNSQSEGRQTVGLRFSKVDIPKQAVIKKAYIQFTADEKTIAGCSLEIRGEETDSSVEFNNTDKDISGRSRTKSALGWRAARWTRAGQSNVCEQSPDLKAIVQEIIDRPGWSPQNSLSFIVTGLGMGHRTAISFETSPLKAARLVVEYEVTVYRNKEN